MRVIALMNQKGGVGKTTTTVNLGAALAELGAKVCLIDLDPQSHLTINYGIEPAGEHCSLYEILVQGHGILEGVQKVDDRLAVVPGSIDLAAAEVELVNIPGRETILSKRLAVAIHDFDYVLLDCPPSLGLLTINALAAADEVIIPMQPHFLALQGVGKLLETVALVRQRMNPRLRVAGIVLTMFDSQTRLTSDVVDDLRGFITAAQGKDQPWSNAVIYRSHIRRNIKLAECPSFGKTIFQYGPTSHGAADYRALAREVAGIEAADGGATTDGDGNPAQVEAAAGAVASAKADVPVAAKAADAPVKVVVVKPGAAAPKIVPAAKVAAAVRPATPLPTNPAPAVAKTPTPAAPTPAVTVSINPVDMRRLAARANVRTAVASSGGAAEEVRIPS
jgi:chromosome partitioning protein